MSMRTRLPVMTLAFVASMGMASSASDAREWRFAVSLDGKPIGYHHFRLQERDGHRELQSKARFNVKFLFINAYSYAHDAQESWRGDCLATIDAHTDDDGEEKVVSGKARASVFTLAVDEQDERLDGCVMSFAYWNPNILLATRLLNPQTGEYVPVAIERVGADTVAVRGVSRPADHFRILGDARRGGPLRIDLWYSPEQEWLALESTTEGRRIRYQIQ